MYPDQETLMEVGRIAIAAGRLDANLGALWWHLAPDRVDELEARKAPAGTVRGEIKKLARQRLEDEHQVRLLAFVEEVAAAQAERNTVLHSRWLLRGPDAMRPVSEFLRLDDAERAAYLEGWERQALASDDWQRQPNDDLTLTQRPKLDELVKVERRLRNAAEVAVRWLFLIASMRETGSPPGWQGPPEARRGHQPTLNGPAVYAVGAP